VRRPRRPAEELRIAVECLPDRTRLAMLDGIDANRIIVGAYTDERGGICPMLAAHRCGGRTNLASFARAWDRYTKASTRPRPATERELRTLRAMLETSLVDDGYLLSEVVDDVKAVRRDEAARLARRSDQGWLTQVWRGDRAEAERELERV
jgi:hypothetical protein